MTKKKKKHKEITKKDLIINQYFLNVRDILDITPNNQYYPKFEDWIRKTPIIYTESTFELIEKAENRQIPEYSYLFEKYNKKKNLSIDELSEMLIKDLKIRLKKELKEEEVRYPYEISADDLIYLITHKNAKSIIEKEYGDYTDYYKLFKKNITHGS